MSAPVPFQESGYAASLPPEHRVFLQPETAPPPRLNLLLPHAFQEHAFGGVLSALEIGKALSAHYPTFRLVCEHSLAGVPEQAMFSPSHWCSPGAAAIPQVHSLADAPLPCHQREIFCCTWWTTTLAWEAYAADIRGTGRPTPPFYYIIQDFEPGFYQLGSNYMASLASYQHGEHCCAIINSQELAAFFQHQGIAFQQSVVLRPSLNPVLREVLNGLGWRLHKTPAPLVICLYGRPEQPRNCFASLVDGLRRFVAELDMGQREQLVLASLGKPHDPLELAPGAVLTSLGRLPLSQYATFLSGSHVGLSMMATPHPSYPPLEMATFGLEVLTNDFPGKALAGTHPQLHTIPQPSAPLIAAALPDVIAKARAKAGSPQPVTLPSCMAGTTWADNIRKAQLPKLDVPG